MVGDKPEIDTPAPQQPNPIPGEIEQNSNMNILKIYFMLFIFRFYNVILLKTWFDPDETWQSLEVAHNIVFGVGKLTWYSLLTKGIYGPRILQAGFAALTDLYAFLLSFKMFGIETARWTLTCMIFSWFNFYCLVRTYSNSLEATLTIVALYYWPNRRSSRKEFRIALAVAAFACIIRPTNVLIWVYMGGVLLSTFSHRTSSIIYDVTVTGVFALLFSLGIDFIFYKRFIFVHWEFLKINVVEKVSLFYGSHPFHWYFTQAIPLVAFTLLPFSIYGVSKLRTFEKRNIFYMCVFVCLALSLQAHKEFRFLMPILPPILVYAGRGLHYIQKSDKRLSRGGPKSLLVRSLFFIISTNVLLGYYFSRYHKSGVLQVVKYLRHQAYLGRVKSVLFLMPCHSTPFYSHIHLNIPMRYITCEPPIHQNRTIYRDETDLLYQDPEKFISTYFEGKGTIKVPYQNYTIPSYSWPSHLVWYDNPHLKPVLEPILFSKGYFECARFFNTHFHDDDKQAGDLVISCTQKWLVAKILYPKNSTVSIPRKVPSVEEGVDIRGEGILVLGEYTESGVDNTSSAPNCFDKSMKSAIALYDCVGEDTSELSFRKGDVITKVEPHTEKGWCVGQVGSQRGLFPLNYVKENDTFQADESLTQFSAPYQIKPAEKKDKIDVNQTRQQLLGRSSSIVNEAIKNRTLVFEDANQNPWAQQAKQRPKPPVPTRPQSEVFTKPSINRPQSEITTNPLYSSPKPPIPQRPKSNDADTMINKMDSPKVQPKRPAPAPPRKPDVFSMLEASENQNISPKSPESIDSERSATSNDQFLSGKPVVPLGTKPAINRPAIPPPSTKPLSNSSSEKPPIFDRLNNAVNRPAPLPPRPALKLIHNIPEDAYLRYQELFRQSDKFQQGYLSANTARNIWLKSQLAPIKLGQIWKLLETTNGGLNELEFCIGMYQIDELLRGKELVQNFDNFR
ncbi:hypothetical protein HDV01_004550 [Terramyces sp. JEL0728]|nr:hypothetical protein HDV01_004550 [Terramyces sp. JEL0728]